MLKTIDACLQASTNLLRPVCVGHDGEFEPMGLVDYRENLIHGHLILIDQLDYIDSGFGEHPHFCARIFSALHAPAEVLSTRIRLVLNKWAGNIKRGARKIAFFDSITHGEACL